MSSIRGMNTGFFFGMLVGEWSICNEIERIDRFCGDGYMSSFAGIRRVTVSMSMLVCEAIPFFVLGRSDAYVLGDGAICQYCGDYNPAGLAYCHRCGGKTEWRPSVGLKRLPFIADSMSTQCDADDLVAIDMSWQSTGEVSTKDLSSFVGMDLETGKVLNSGFVWGREDYYLCSYCGQAVKEGCICPSCTGVRHPWSEILKMDRECVYCGRKVVGGIVCPGCGRRLAGTTVADAKRRIAA
jgi:hypothetical protein